MKKTIRKPENWQDFESLCKKLWGEIWECHSIKKNGRNGQAQHGVDVYGVPTGESEYFGIQCKGKDDYSQAELTIKEIDEEILKAIEFKPPLKHFIFATTANKDARIEEYIRVKDVESRKNNLFSIELCAWEDIADLIEDNRDTFNFYMKGVDHKTKYDVSILFQNDSNSIELHPKFEKYITIIDSTYDPSVVKNIFGTDYYKTLQSLSVKHYDFSSQQRNLSFCKLGIEIVNSGSIALEEYKLILSFEDLEVQEISENDTHDYLPIISLSHKPYWIDGNNIIYKPMPPNRMLIQKDKRYFEFFIKPKPENYEIKLKWHFLAKDFDLSGVNIITIIPEFKENKTIRQPRENESDESEYFEIQDCKVKVEEKEKSRRNK